MKNATSLRKAVSMAGTLTGSKPERSIYPSGHKEDNLTDDQKPADNFQGYYISVLS